MKYAMKKSSSVLLALAATVVMQTAFADSTANNVPRCHDSFAADWVGSQPCPSTGTGFGSFMPLGFGQSGTMQTYPDGLDLHADHIQSGYHPVKISPFDYL
jgi:hypothetical protein